jgi:glycosyltransferase involved in cell wall biosynthesis
MESALRITMIAPFGIRPKGTLLARMLPLANALATHGHTVTIVAPPVHNPKDAGTHIQHGATTVIHTAIATLPGALGVLQQAHLLWRATTASQPQLIHLFKPKGHAGLAAYWASIRAPHIPLVVDCDDREGAGGWNDVLPYPRSAKALFAWQEHALPRRAASVTVASRTLEGLVWAEGVTPSRVFYLPNAADMAETATPPPLRHEPHIVLYTRFWEFTISDLVRTLTHIVTQRPDVRITVIGAGEHGEEQHLAQQCAAVNIAPHIDIRGWMQPDQIPTILARAGLALVPVDDTLINRARCSAKLLELLAAGLPVIGNDVGEMRTFVTHGVNGMLTPPHQPQALAQAAVDIMADITRWHALQQAAYHSAQQHTWLSRVTTVEAAYAGALKK